MIGTQIFRKESKRMKQVWVAAVLSVALFLCVLPVHADAEKDARNYGAVEPIRSVTELDGSVTKTYRFEASAPSVDTQTLFFDGLNAESNETPVHFCLETDGLTLYFAYDLLYRNIGKYAPFTMQAALCAPEEIPGFPPGLAEKLADDAVFVNFSQQEHYPGVAQLTLQLPSMLQGERVSVFRVLYDDEQTAFASLAPIVQDIPLSCDAQLKLTVTESQDYLVISAQSAEKYAPALRDLVQPIVLQGGGLSATAIFCIVGAGVILAGGGVVAVFFLLRRKRRHALLLMQPGNSLQRDTSKPVSRSRKNERKQ